MPPGTVQKVEGDREFAGRAGCGRDWELPGSGAGGDPGLLRALQGIPEYTGKRETHRTTTSPRRWSPCSPFAVAVEETVGS